MVGISPLNEARAIRYLIDALDDLSMVELALEYLKKNYHNFIKERTG